MANTTIAPQTEPEIILCKHKPGEVWADGCCTSRLHQQSEAPSPKENADTETIPVERSESHTAVPFVETTFPFA